MCIKKSNCVSASSDTLDLFILKMTYKNLVDLSHAEAPQNNPTTHQKPSSTSLNYNFPTNSHAGWILTPSRATAFKPSQANLKTGIEMTQARIATYPRRSLLLNPINGGSRYKVPEIVTSLVFQDKFWKLKMEDVHKLWVDIVRGTTSWWEVEREKRQVGCVR